MARTVPDPRARAFVRRFSLPPPGATAVAGSTRADRILAFDPESGRLRAEAGLSLRELAWFFLPRGWFPPVVPGTQYVTLGGMVAADVHGKNHHVAGTFGRHVTALRLLTASGEVVTCSRTHEPELFRGTLGGMGLTGHILDVELTLVRIPSPWIVQETQRLANLEALLDGLNASARAWPHTVCWLDALAAGDALGRGVLMRGRWAEPGERPRSRRHRTRAAGAVSSRLGAQRSLGARLQRALPEPAPRQPRRSVVHPEVLLAARRGAPLEPDLRGSRLHAVPVRAARRGAAGATRRFSPRSRGARPSFLCVLRIAESRARGSSRSSAPASRWRSTCRCAVPRGRSSRRSPTW